MWLEKGVEPTYHYSIFNRSYHLAFSDLSLWKSIYILRYTYVSSRRCWMLYINCRDVTRSFLHRLFTLPLLSQTAAWVRVWPLVSKSFLIRQVTAKVCRICHISLGWPNTPLQWAAAAGKRYKFGTVGVPVLQWQTALNLAIILPLD